MSAYRTSVMFMCLLFCSLLLLSCSPKSLLTGSPGTATNVPAKATSIPTTSPTKITNLPATATPIATGTAETTPAHFNSRILFQKSARPDDMVFDNQGRIIFGDIYNGTINRLNADGSVTVLLSGLLEPEGMVILSDGTLIFAEQKTNRILSLAPGSHTPIVLRVLPGTPSTQPCKDGVDQIAYDPTTKTIIVPDSPIGDVYRMSIDGKTLTLLVSGIVRPVGATVDSKGIIYIADECGGSIWRVTPTGKTSQITDFGMPDDVALDSQGNLLVIDLKTTIHALIRLNLTTGKREVLASRGFIEPQGLLVDSHDNIYVSDDYANIIVEYSPA